MKILNNFITVDPGSEGTGVAFFLQDKIPILVSNLNSEHKSWNMKCNEICYKFAAFLGYTIEEEYKKQEHALNLKVFCEQPQFFDSFFGLTVMRSQSPIKLTVLFGRLWQITVDQGLDFLPLKIVDWKGQLNKQQTANRIFNLIKQEYKTTHECDAVAMGLFLKGLF